MDILNKDRLIRLVRQKADLENSKFVTDEEIKSYLDLAFSNLYNIIVDTNQDFFINKIDFVAENHPVQLPLDCYKLRALDYFYANNNYFTSARPVGFMQRQREQDSILRPYTWKDESDGPVRYSLRGRELKIFLNGLDEVPAILWYIPKPKKIGEGASLPTGWENYLIHSACLDARIKQDTSSREFMQRLMHDKQEILSYCQRRNYDGNDEIQDVYNQPEDAIDEYFQGDTVAPPNLDSRVLLPTFGYRTYVPKILQEYQTKRRYVKMFDDKAVVGLELPAGLTSPFGQWVIMVMFKESGNLYLTQKANENFPSLDAAWASLPGPLNIDASMYRETSDYYGPTKLYYNFNEVYTLDLDQVLDPPFESPFKDRVQIAGLAYWAGELPPDRKTSDELQTDSGSQINLDVPVATTDSFLVLAVESGKRLSGVFFSDSPDNQLSAFTFSETHLGIDYYVSNQILRHDLVGRTVQIVL